MVKSIFKKGMSKKGVNTINKKGMELSINFIVIFILAIVVFAFGIRMAYSLFNKGIETKATLDRQTELEIAKLLDTGEKVVIPFDEQEVRKGKFGVFGVGIRNVLDSDGEKDTFKIEVEFSGAFDKEGKKSLNNIGPIPSSNPSPASSLSVQVKKNEVQKVPISFSVPSNAVSGRYVFNVRVFQASSSEQYGFTKQVTLVVP